MNSAILLAAGQSSRMGSLKALLPWGGRTLLEKQLDELVQSTIDEVVVVLGFQADLLKPLILEATRDFATKLTIKIRINRHYEAGKTSSIRLGMKHLAKASDNVLIIGVDQPVRAVTINTLLSSRAELAIPVYQGRKGHPPLFASSLYKKLEAITEETEGLRAVIRHHPGCQLIEVGQPQILLNLNEQSQYEQAIARQLDGY
ncbi:nucleotidyltransferase family protein [Alkalihalobacillus oceani]|uniref:Nucleotidyltransferase family protein n=1 Tax=Halalkalibacter oceani TaxID=1653776 RepID=A0A9X2DUY7_9BACI|nr:nucleotidyltransferase family protein [Halalkalibacter oceani]MCM3715918.1 nucleotidyltransferase family protein [Halalkalibacter oceani]